jgi:hypothetical protein
MQIAAYAVPTIDTERLTMRGYAPDDFDEYRAMWAIPR